VGEKCKELWILGSAAMITEMSSTIIRYVARMIESTAAVFGVRSSLGRTIGRPGAVTSVGVTRNEATFCFGDGSAKMEESSR
jgi:hypothetical protein